MQLFPPGHGYEVKRRGWPDFSIWRNGTLVAVAEVKPYAAKPLKPHQEEMLEQLSALGLPSFKWTPEDGYTEISPSS